MNIPAPFRKALPTPPLPVSVPVLSAPPPPPPPSSETNMEDLSSSESEMESSDEVILWALLLSHIPILFELAPNKNWCARRTLIETHFWKVQFKGILLSDVFFAYQVKGNPEAK